MPEECEHATQLVKCKGKWFAVFPEKVPLVPSKSDLSIALDPGVRTFLTGFDGSKFLEFGRGDMGRITRLCQHLDDLMGRAGLCKNRRQRQKMYKAAGRMRTKIQNLVNETHKQVVAAPFAVFLKRRRKAQRLPNPELPSHISPNFRDKPNGSES